MQVKCQLVHGRSLYLKWLMSFELGELTPQNEHGFLFVEDNLRI
jgi:hypothetical protein